MLYHSIKQQLQVRLQEGGGGLGIVYVSINCLYTPLGSINVIRAIISSYIEINAVFCTFINLCFKIFAGKDLLSTYYLHIVRMEDGSAESYNKQDLFPAFQSSCCLVEKTDKHRNNTEGQKKGHGNDECGG